MTRRSISRVADPALRKLYRDLHASPVGQRGKRRKALTMGACEILKLEWLAKVAPLVERETA